MLRTQKNTKCRRKANTAVEYLLLLAVVVIVALGAFQKYFPRVNSATDDYFNIVSRGVMDAPPNTLFMNTALN